MSFVNYIFNFFPWKIPNFEDLMALQKVLFVEEAYTWFGPLWTSLYSSTQHHTYHDYSYAQKRIIHKNYDI